MMSARRVLPVAALLVPLACGAPDPESTASESNPLYETVTGAGVSFLAEQSETVTSVNYLPAGYPWATTFTITSNDETISNQVNQTIRYTQTDRIVCCGATMMGYNWKGGSPAGGNWSNGTVLPWSGSQYPILWGDPGMTKSLPNQDRIFISNLAFTEAKWENAGQQGVSCLNPSAPHCQSVSFAGTFIGGACIAQSTNGGQSFNLCQCFSRYDHTSQGDFYDGGSMASSSAGEIFAAFTDADTNKLNVWRSPTDGTCNFQLLPDPPIVAASGAHPRIRWSAGDLYLAAQDRFTNQIDITRYHNGAWTTPATTFEAAPWPNPTITYTVSPSLFVRTAGQFMFDVGVPSHLGAGDDAVRLMYTVNAGSVHHIHGLACSADLSRCVQATGWSTDNVPGDQYNPDVRFGDGDVWGANFINAFGGQAWHGGGVLSVTGPDAFSYTPGQLDAPGQTPCPDLRGFWGDYDVMDALEVPGIGKSKSFTFMRGITDSTVGCPVRWQFYSQHQHVSDVQWTYVTQ